MCNWSNLVIAIFKTSTTLVLSISLPSAAFKFVLGSCPLLEEFKLNGWIGAYSALNLDFRQHDQLKYIGIDLKGCRYYIFDNNFDMKWKNVAIQMLKSDITQFELLHYYPYFINLAWITNNNVKLQLSGSKASG